MKPAALDDFMTVLTALLQTDTYADYGSDIKTDRASDRRRF
jgi:hypothetical protein